MTKLPKKTPYLVTKGAGVLVLVIAGTGIYLGQGLTEKGGFGCGQEVAGASQSRLVDMGVRAPLYLFSWSGQLVRRDLVTGADTVLSDHGFAAPPSTVRSADGRWIVYFGVLADRPFTQYWLYDMQTGHDRLVLEHPAWGGSIPAFSPDGHQLAIAANYDDRWPNNSSAGIYVFETASPQATRLGVPGGIPAEAAWTAAEWSNDGSRLLLMTLDHRPGTRDRTYTSWGLGETSVRPIAARWVDQSPPPGRVAWLAEAGEIQVFEQHRMQGSQGHRLAPSPDGAWTPRLEQHGDTSALEVVGKDGRARQVDTGHYDQCEGYAVSVIGWIDAGHLVYRKPGSITLVYEPATGRVAPLLKANDHNYLFGW